MILRRKTKEPYLIIGSNQKLRVADDGEIILWCHPPMNNLRFGSKAARADGKPACGTDDQHCEVTLFCSQRPKRGEYTIYNESGGISLSPSLICPYCYCHIWLKNGGVTPCFIAPKYSHPPYWTPEGGLTGNKVDTSI